MSEIVLTYFEPFGGRNSNASKDVAALFASQFQLLELKVNWLEVESQLQNLEEPRYLFMIGEAGKYENITIELQANNIASGIDNNQKNKDNEKISLDGSDSLRTKIDFTNYKGRASFSNDAGKYLCNYSYYQALTHFKNAKVVFIHVPYISDKNPLPYLCEELKGIIAYTIHQDLYIEKYSYRPEEAKEIRYQIFIKEQGFDKEFDEIDEKSTHFLVSLNESKIATCRLFYDEENKAYHLGRIAIKKEYRKLGIGKWLINKVEDYLLSISQHQVILGAQVVARGFYEKCGFEAYGEIFYDEFSPHIMMKKSF